MFSHDISCVVNKWRQAPAGSSIPAVYTHTHTRRQAGKAGAQTSLLSLLVGGLFVLIPSGDEADKHTAENSQARSHSIPLLEFSVYFSPSKRIRRVRNSGSVLGEGRLGAAWWGWSPAFPAGSKPKGGHSQLGTGKGPWLWIPSSCRKPSVEVGIHSRRRRGAGGISMVLSAVPRLRQSPGTSGLGASKQRNEVCSPRREVKPLSFRPALFSSC